jgi:hypothetical protein
MPRPPSPELQSLARQIRQLMRNQLVRGVMTEPERMFLCDVTSWYLMEYSHAVRQPVFLKKEILDLVRKTQRMVDNGQSPNMFRFRFLKLLLRALRLMMGYFCGRRPPIEPNTQCSICQFEHGGNWWFSRKCCHCFHTKCIAAHFFHDSRCPLCRVEFL